MPGVEAGRHDLVLDVAREQVVLRLQRRGRGEPEPARRLGRLGDLPAQVVREAVGVDLAQAHRVVEEAQRLLRRRQRVPGVGLVEVHGLDAQAPQRVVERPREVPARQAVIVRPLGAHGEAALGGHHHLRGLRRTRHEPAPHDLLG
jgi:hypothetical protein